MFMYGIGTTTQYFDLPLAALSRQKMENCSEFSSILYLDGQVIWKGC